MCDVDGNEYVDLHAGFGAMLVGHAHPAIVEAVSRAGRARHPLRPADTATLIVVAGELRPPLRPAAVALRQLRHRGDDGRRPPDAGRHRSPEDHQGRGQLPRSPRRGAGLGVPDARGCRAAGVGPASVPDHVAVSRPRSRAPPSSCRSATSTRCERVLLEHPGEIAGMIIEPAMMNIGVIPPPDGLPRRRSRDLLHAARRAASRSTR